MRRLNVKKSTAFRPWRFSEVPQNFARHLRRDADLGRGACHRYANCCGAKSFPIPFVKGNKCGKLRCFFSDVECLVYKPDALNYSAQSFWAVGGEMEPAGGLPSHFHLHSFWKFFRATIYFYLLVMEFHLLSWAICPGLRTARFMSQKRGTKKAVEQGWRSLENAPDSRFPNVGWAIWWPSAYAGSNPAPCKSFCKIRAVPFSCL